MSHQKEQPVINTGYSNSTQAKKSKKLYPNEYRQIMENIHPWGVSKQSWHSWEIKTLGTSYSETTNL